MKLHYRLEIDDQVAFACHHNRTVNRMHWIWNALMFLGIFFIGLHLFQREELELDALYVVGAGVVVAIVVLLLPPVRDGLVARNVRALYGTGSHLGLLGEHELELTAEGLVERTIVSEHRVTWRGIERIATDEAHTFIYLSCHTAHVVPERVEGGDYAGFVAALIERWEAHHRSTAR